MKGNKWKENIKVKDHWLIKWKQGMEKNNTLKVYYKKTLGTKEGNFLQWE